MIKPELPPPPKCKRCGGLTEWRKYKNPEWAKDAERYQAFCPTCGKMSEGRIAIPSLMRYGNVKSGKEGYLKRIRHRDKRRGYV